MDTRYNAGLYHQGTPKAGNTIETEVCEPSANIIECLHLLDAYLYNSNRCSTIFVLVLTPWISLQSPAYT